MPDEAFEKLWSQKGGPELVVLHSLFGGSAFPATSIREVLDLTLEQLRTVLEAAQRVGLVETAQDKITFVLFPSDSGQGARLEWCLEPHTGALPALAAKLKSRLLIRFLSSPPGQAA